jgi:hypothetical protein
MAELWTPDGSVRRRPHERALLREVLDGSEDVACDAPGREPATAEERSATVVSGALDGLGLPRTFRFDEERVKANLDELLLALVALRGEETHGKGLIGDLASLFDTTASPGTVYPRLHDLADEELLEAVELVRTKEYHVADEEAVRARLDRSIRQHLALAMVFEAALLRE